MGGERDPLTDTNFLDQLREGFKGLSRITTIPGMITLLDQSIVSAVNFLTGVIIGRVCSKEQLGLYMLGFSIIVFVVNLQSSLIAAPYMVHSPRLSGRELVIYTTNTLIQQLCLSVLATATLAIGGVLLAAGYGPPGLASVVLVLALVITAITIREFLRQLSFAWLNIREAFLLDCCVAIIQLGGLLFLVFREDLSAHKAIFVSGVACGLAGAFWLYQQRSHFSIPAGSAAAHFKRNWLLGKWNLAGGLANLAGFQAYPWILTMFHGNASTGVLAACLGVVFIANPVIIGFGNFMGPKITHAFAKKGVAEVDRIVKKAALLICLIMGSFSVVMFIFGGTMLRIIYGFKYAGFDRVVGVLALSQLCEVVSLTPILSLFVMGRPDAGFKSYLLGLLVTFTFGLWLVRSHGVTGVAFSLLVANATAAGYRWIVYRKIAGSLMTSSSG